MLIALGATCLILGAVCCYLASGCDTKKPAIAYWLSAFLLFLVGAYLTNYAPYIAGVAGVFLAAFVVLNFFNPLSKRAKATGLSIGLLVVGAALLAAFAGLYVRPTNDQSGIEDRKDFEPKPIVERTPNELLKLDWSTTDAYSDWPVASLMLQLSDIAYNSPVEAKKLIAELGFPASESINAGAMQGYVIDAGDDSIIALRGTERHEYDLLQDLRFLKRKTQDGSMHGGFVNGYDPMHDQVLQLLEQYDTKRVWIAGHSLGGALAVVCAYRLSKDDKYPIAGVMTFGQPKVVRSDMAEYLADKLAGKYVFFVNQLDPVARLINPYEHFGHMVWWNGQKIERSKHLVMYSAGGDTESESVPSESGYVESMSDDDLDELIEKLEHTVQPVYDKDGNLVVQGMIIQGQDHYLDSYRDMLETLRTHRTEGD